MLDRFIFPSLIILILSVLALLIFAPSFTQDKLKKITNHPDYRELIEVPDLLGKSIEETKSLLSQLDLKINQLPVSVYNPNFPIGSIVRQDPKPGNFVKNGRTIYVTPNPDNVTQIAIPNYYDKSFRSIRSLLKNSRLELGRILYCNNYAENAVIRLDYDGKQIQIGDSVPVFSKIDVYLGAGKRNINEKTIKVPNLIGKKFMNFETGQKVQDLIKNNFFNVGKFHLDEIEISDTSDFFIYKQFPLPDIDTNFMFINEGGMSPQLNLFLTRDSTKLNHVLDSISNLTQINN